MRYLNFVKYKKKISFAKTFFCVHYKIKILLSFLANICKIQFNFIVCLYTLNIDRYSGIKTLFDLHNIVQVTRYFKKSNFIILTFKSKLYI